jgi:tetratricopeptide (TPR) repeat protein
MFYPSAAAGQDGSRAQGSRPAPAPATQQDFDKLAAAANAARENGKIDDAIDLFGKALQLRSQWVEGWWYLATLLYDRDKYAEAARAFKEAAKLQPNTGAPLAMLGLCEFQLGRYDDALHDIQRGRELGLGDNTQLIRVTRYHEGLLSLLNGGFERAQIGLSALSYEGMNSEDLIVALGLSVLRISMLPKKVDADYHDREVIRRAGLAEHFNAQKNIGDATREYELLARDFPKFPNVQYAYGRFLLAIRDNEGALPAFFRELQNSPDHALARMQIA